VLVGTPLLIGLKPNNNVMYSIPGGVTITASVQPGGAAQRPGPHLHPGRAVHTERGRGLHGYRRGGAGPGGCGDVQLHLPRGGGRRRSDDCAGSAESDHGGVVPPTNARALPTTHQMATGPSKGLKPTGQTAGARAGAGQSR
jgi:hypothetical protein